MKKADVEKFMQAHSQAISDWAYVEEGLFSVFDALMVSPALGPPSCAFLAVENVRSKIEMVDSMVRHSKAGRTVLPEWEKLLKRCNNQRRARNQLAHRKVVQFKLGKQKSKPALVRYSFDIRHSLKDEFEIPNYFILASVKTCSIEFRRLGTDLNRFASGIPKPPLKSP